MTLSFRTHWGKEMGDLAGKPTHFAEKIIRGLYVNEIICRTEQYYLVAELNKKNRFHINLEDVVPKFHTIREDKKDRWKVGSKIHFVVNNRTKDRFQFAPVLQVKSIQKIEFIPTWERGEGRRTMIIIDGLRHGTFWHDIKVLVGGRYVLEADGFGESEGCKLAKNDGFDTLDDFFKFFKNDRPKTYKLIHWTTLKY